MYSVCTILSLKKSLNNITVEHQLVTGPHIIIK